MKRDKTISLFTYISSEDEVEITLGVVEHCISVFEFEDIVICSKISDLDTSKFEALGARFVFEDDLDSSYESYNFFKLNRLDDHINTDFVLTVENDGFIIDASFWEDEFLDYDYIGSPWYDPIDDPKYRVGNGGFSLRSKKLLEATKIITDSRDGPFGNEDMFICWKSKKVLESFYKIKFAPVELAAKFAVELTMCPEHNHVIMDNLSTYDTFGFHGVEHTPLMYSTFLKNQDMKKIIITGVTGQDGSFMADYLLKNTRHTIIAGVRRLSVKNHSNIAHLVDNPRFKLIDLDVADQANTDMVIAQEKPDYFINFAANSFVGVSWKMPVNHMETNAMAVLYQLEAIRKHCPNCRYYNAGSSEEFGDVLHSPQSEIHPLRPRSPYGVSKASARHMVKVWRDSYDLYAIQGWLFNHEGTRRGEEFVTRKITKNVCRIKKEYHLNDFKPLELGNIDAKRDWSDAEDFVEGIWMMLNQEKPKEYVLSSNETHSIREFVEEAFNFAGFAVEKCEWVGEGINEKYMHEGKILMQINPEFYRPAEVDLLLGDSDLARKELGWSPKTDFLGLVRKMVATDIDPC